MLGPHLGATVGGSPQCTWPLITQLVISHFLHSSRVFAPKCASCARPILPAQVGTTCLEMTRCLALARLLQALGPHGRDEKPLLPHTP